MIRFIQKLVAGRRIAGLEGRIADLQDQVARLRGKHSYLQYENTELKAEIYWLAGEKSELSARADAAEAQIEPVNRHNAALLQKMVDISSLSPMPILHVGPAKCQACEDRRIADLNRNGEEKRDLEKQNDAQAARAMSRNTKQAFQAYQAAVKQILDKLNDLGKSNMVTKEDLRRLRQLRKDLGDQIGRSI